MNCALCVRADDAYNFEKDMNNDILQKCNFVFPEFLKPESQGPVLICATCLAGVTFFSTIKKICLDNIFRLKCYNDILTEKNDVKFRDLNVVIKGSVQLKQDIELESKDFLLSDDQHVILQEKDDIYHNNDQVMCDKSSLNYVEDSCSRSNNINKEIHQNAHSDCASLNKTFAEKGQTKGIITWERPFKCLTCSKTFKHRTYLRKHKVIHAEEKPHECDICHKKFSLKALLASHIRFHHTERPYQCSLCDKTFNGRDRLVQHVRTHTGEKPYPCHICSYRSVLAINLKRHIRTHTGEKPYSCEHCDNSFSSKHHLNRHRAKCH